MRLNRIWGKLHRKLLMKLLLMEPAALPRFLLLIMKTPQWRRSTKMCSVSCCSAPSSTARSLLFTSNCHSPAVPALSVACLCPPGLRRVSVSDTWSADGWRTCLPSAGSHLRLNMNPVSRSLQTRVCSETHCETRDVTNSQKHFTSESHLHFHKSVPDQQQLRVFSPHAVFSKPAELNWLCVFTGNYALSKAPWTGQGLCVFSGNTGF